MSDIGDRLVTDAHFFVDEFLRRDELEAFLAADYGPVEKPELVEKIKGIVARLTEHGVEVLTYKGAASIRVLNEGRDWHRDACPIAMLIYLSDPEGGGLEVRGGVRGAHSVIQPRAGLVVLIESSGAIHRSEPVTAGDKVVLTVPLTWRDKTWNTFTEDQPVVDVSE